MKSVAPVGGFSRGFLFGLTCLLSLVVLFIFFFNVIFYGTGCPSATSQNFAVSVKYTSDIHSFTNFYCYNPAKWANPSITTNHNVTTSDLNPTNVFLGICVLPPGWTMLVGMLYSFVFGIFYIIGVIAAFKNRMYYVTFIYWAWRAIIFNLVVTILNLASWLFLLVREGQNDNGATQGICAGFAVLNWDFCAYVAGQFVFFVVFTVLAIIANHLARMAFTKEGAGARSNSNSVVRGSDESEESLLHA